MRTGAFIGAVGVMAVLAPEADQHAFAVAGEDFPAALHGGLALLTLVLAGWMTLVLGLSASPRLVRLAVALTPRALRGLVLGSAAGVLALGPAHAGGEGPPTPTTTVLDGLRLPDRPTLTRSIGDQGSAAMRPSPTPAGLPANPVPATPVPAASSRPVVVQPGDSLWAIAAERLPAGSPTERIASATTAWHDANREVIGPDADLIHPGQQLHPPREDRP